MCGMVAYFETRKTSTAECFQIDQVLTEFEPSYKISPTDQIPVIINHHKKRVLRSMRWGLIPSWSVGEEFAKKWATFNARSETILTTKSFCGPFASTRCVIVADHFYEGRKPNRMEISLKNKKPMAMAGVWDTWEGDGQVITSCTIITTEPNEAGS